MCAVLNPLRGVLNPLRGVLNPLQGILNPLRGVLNPLRVAILRLYINGSFWQNMEPDQTGSWETVRQNTLYIQTLKTKLQVSEKTSCF